MDFEYDKQLKAAQDRLEVAAGAIKVAAQAVEVAATTLIDAHTPAALEEAIPDVVDAGAAARSTCRQLANTADQAKELAGELGALHKLLGKVEFAGRKLFAPLLQRAEAEERHLDAVHPTRWEVPEPRRFARHDAPRSGASALGGAAAVLPWMGRPVPLGSLIS